MLWKIYAVIFTIINILSIISFRYGTGFGQVIGLISLILSVGLNIAVYSYTFKKPIFSKVILDWLFKLNLGLYGLFFFFEFITFLQEAIGRGVSLPTSGLVSVIASFPSLPALYATYKLAYSLPKKTKGKRKRLTN